MGCAMTTAAAPAKILSASRRVCAQTFVTLLQLRPQRSGNYIRERSVASSYDVKRLSSNRRFDNLMITPYGNSLHLTKAAPIQKNYVSLMLLCLRLNRFSITTSRVLHAVRRAAPLGARLLLVEAMMPEQPELVRFNGRESFYIEDQEQAKQLFWTMLLGTSYCDSSVSRNVVTNFQALFITE